ncbi:MAG TPA: VWA domain-containing protein [Pyrinomonadaceae bacterium]
MAQTSRQEPAQPPSAAAQQQQPQPRPSPSAQDDDVVRITSNLVQFDAVVTDKNGRHVIDLGAEDFEILIDGKRQEITNFSYVSNEAGAGVPTPTPKKNPDKNAPPAPPVRLRPEKVRRTIALVVDDLGTSFESTYYVREALKKFVDQQMQPDDLVAIIRTSAGVGALQQFTSDKRMLHAAIERVRWNPSGRAGIGAFAPMAADPLARVRADGDEGTARTAGGRDTENLGAGDVDEFREEIFSVGTLGALNYVVRGLNDLPGRKSVIMFSDGFRIHRRDDSSFNQRVVESLRRLTDLANRASVVIYTIDARGLQTLGLTAADNTAGMTGAEIEQNLMERRNALFDTQDGLNYLAQQTGGFFIKNSNDLAGGVRKVIEDQRGYYLIGFRPGDEVFDATRIRFNKIKVNLLRPGLKTRTRGGFYGFTEETARPVRRTREEQIMAALTSPFGSGEIPLRVTSIYSNEGEKNADFLNSLCHIDASKLKFEPEADGWHKAVFDVAAITFGADGRVVDEISRIETVRARHEALESVLRGGLIFSMRVPVKKPGAYQLRVAVRDEASERVGSASQFVEVPNLKKKRLALSGIIMRGTPTAAAAHNRSAPATGNDDAGAGNAAAAAGNSNAARQGVVPEGPQLEADPATHAAVRRFKQGSQADFFYYIYNAKLDRAAQRPQLTTQFRLFRDGQPVHTGTAVPYNPDTQSDMDRLIMGTRIRFNAALAPGEYVLQVIVTDALAKDPKSRTATQWIDFEVTK